MATLKRNGTALSSQDQIDLRRDMGLGTAATAATGDFATAAQGTAADNHAANTANPHGTTKAQVGLGNVDNLSPTGLAAPGNAVGDALAALTTRNARTPGLRVVLIGDSMTDWYSGGHVSTTYTSIIYTASTGVLDLIYTATPPMYDGVMAAIWASRASALTGLMDQQYVPLVRITNTTWRAQLPANLANVPNGTDIKADLSVRIDGGRATCSWVNWLQMRRGWPLTVVRNSAQSGDRSLGMLARLSRDVLPQMPALAIGQEIGINDLGDPNPRTEAEILADRQSAYGQIIAAGGQLILGTITPVSSIETARAQLNTMLSVRRLNDATTRYVRNNRTWAAQVDHHSVYVDPANATGLAPTSALRSDGIHHSTKGAIAIAKRWDAVLDKVLPTHDSTLPQSVIDCRAGAALTITSCSSTADVVTVNATTHRYKVGDEFGVHNASSRAMNGVWVVETATANSFTFTVPGLGTVGSITGRIISRSRNIWNNPLFLQTSGGTNNMTSAGITGTVPALCGLGGSPFSAATWVGTTGSRAAVAPATSKLPPPVGNEWYVDITTAPAATSNIDMGFQGTTTYGVNAGGGQLILPNRSYVHEFVLSVRSTNWTATPVRNIFATFSVADAGGFSATSGPLSAQDASESNLFAEDLHIHIRTPVIKTTVTAGQELNSASWVCRVNLEGAGFTGQTLTIALQQMATWDVTGQEDLYL